MFTRYSGVDVPQNYSGNRFRKKSIEDTEMKIHSNQTQGAIKSSVSPSFESQFNNNYIQENEDVIVIENEEQAQDIIENEVIDLESEDIKPLEKDDNKAQEIEPVNKSLLNELSPITDYLKNIKSDDLLLIALIILLASDKNTNNNDIIILLALLLVYHT